MYVHKPDRPTVMCPEWAVYHGEEAEWLKHQALQLMLRLQVKELRQLWALPEVFEVS